MPSDSPALTRWQIADIDERALQLVAIAHGDGDSNDVARLTAKLDRAGLIGLAISCAAMVNPDRPLSELLAWLRDPAGDTPDEDWTDAELRAAHAAFGRGDRTPKTVHGERIYHRLRKRRARSTERRTA